jgi:peptidoglycan/xylan/chitin deacetylase (PgdA/CDA1 family)
VDPKKRDTKIFSVRQSDIHDSWVYDSDQRLLLRSTGHPFRDGRWAENLDGSFYTLREKESACLGPSFPASTDHFQLKGEGDSGGSPVDVNWRPAIARYYDSSAYYGSFADNRPLDPVVIDWFDWLLELNAQGTNFIRRYRPGNPLISTGQFFGELHQLPRLPVSLRAESKRFRDLAKSVGDDYLNIEFGWKPFVKDVVQMFTIQQRLENKLRKLVDDNGLSVRKRSKHDVTTTGPILLREGSLSVPFGRLDDVSIGGHSDLEGYVVAGPLGSVDSVFGYGSGQCDYSLTTQTWLRSWSVGTFRYYVPDIGSDRWTAKAKSALLGLEITPSLMWELMPWSWLIDWFTNVGDILSNMSSNAVDNETLTNCFTMRDYTDASTVKVSHHWDSYSNGSPGDPFFLTYPSGASSMEHTVRRVTHMRNQSSPFGFGLDSASFSARQWAILAALGISREIPLSRLRGGWRRNTRTPRYVSA